MFKLTEDNVALAQVHIDLVTLANFLEICPLTIPENLRNCLEKRRERTYHPRVRSHPDFEKLQTWFVSKKKGKAARCSGCLKKDMVKDGDLHLYVTALLYIKNIDDVKETKLRFCMKRSCVTNIRGTLSNVKNMDARMKVSRCPDAVLSVEEENDVLGAGFVIEG